MESTPTPTTEPSPTPSAGDIPTYFLDHVLPLNLATNLNKAIECLTVLTTDFEREDESHFYLEKADLMEVYEMLYHVLSRCYPVNGSSVTSYPALAPVSMTSLAFQTREFLLRHAGKLLNSKKTAEAAEGLMEAIEDMIYSRELTNFADWADVQDVIAKKSTKKEAKGEDAEDVDEEEEEKKDIEARERREKYVNRMDARVD
jgi:hypothetical protein